MKIETFRTACFVALAIGGLGLDQALSSDPRPTPYQQIAHDLNYSGDPFSQLQVNRHNKTFSFKTLDLGELCVGSYSSKDGVIVDSEQILNCQLSGPVIPTAVE